MECKELLKILGDYVDGEVDPSICQEFERHMAGCHPCQVVIDNLRKTIQIYKDGEPCEIPIEFKSRLHSLLRDKWKEVNPPEESNQE